jgi:hypothetical protein
VIAVASTVPTYGVHMLVGHADYNN